MSNIHKGDYAVIQVIRLVNAAHVNKYIGSWKNSDSLVYTKYNIREEDWRVKTASFTSPVHLDLTTGQYAVRIVSKYHENFAGIILDVDYDEDTGLYNYKCQDFSRLYMQKMELIINKVPVWKILMHLITHGGADFNKKISRKGLEPSLKPILSGFRSLDSYDQSLYPKQHYKGNPFKKNDSFIARDKSNIEVIRNIVFNSLGFFDVWFNDRGILQIEPLSKVDWENTGLHLNGDYTGRKFKFSTTNAITFVQVSGNDDKVGKTIELPDFNKLDLTAFFGQVSTSIPNPVKQSSAKNTSNAVKSNNTTVVNKDNPYGTKSKTVYLNIDSIDGYSSDQKKMDDMAKILRKNGWTVKTCGVGSESHYAQRGNVYNGIWFTLYGGACAGTLRESCNNDWYRRPIVNHGSRTVVGFFPPAGDIRKGGKYYEWLPRAHDDGFSGSGFTGVKHPANMLTVYGIPFMYAKNASEMVSKFLKGGENPEACNKDWKFITK